MLIIYDLDGTLIDSRHRQLSLPNGSLDLNHWRENCTAKKIASDSLTRLGRNVARYLASKPAGRHIACTARVMQSYDHDYLLHHGLIFDDVLSRPAECTLPDWQLKEVLLRGYAARNRLSFVRMCRTAQIWDDNQAVLDHLGKFGIAGYHPAQYNGVAI